MLRKVSIALGVLALLAGCAHQGGGHGAHWGYEGESGPEHWGMMDRANAMCSEGRSQSPIDITGAHSMGLQAIEFNYKPIASPEVVNNGHTIQVNYANGSYVVIGGKRYDLLQFHFHTPAENLIDGYRAPMSAHLVHKSGDGQLAVVGVKIDVGADNAFLAPVWSVMPTKLGKAAANATLDINQFLPENKSYYNFSGSLTTPPCSEGVSWNVMKTRVTVSNAQLDALKKLFPMNARPVQPLNDRMIGEFSN